MCCKGPCIFRKEWTIRKQMRVGFISLTTCALLTVFLVALITVLALAAATSDTARSNLEDRLTQHALLTTNEVARVISQKLELVAETVVMTLASQSEALLNLKVGSDDDSDATAWPYKARKVLPGYAMCDQSLVDEAAGNGADYCDIGFAKKSEDTGNPITPCSAYYDTGVGFPIAEACHFTGGSGKSPGDAVSTESSAQGLTNSEIGREVILRSCASSSSCTRHASEKYSTAGVQYTNTQCDRDPLLKISKESACASQKSGSSSTGSSYCCSKDTYCSRTDAKMNAILDDEDVGDGTFRPVVERTQLLDHYADPLWQEFKELDLIYVAYQSPKIAHSSSDGKPTSEKDYAALMRRFPGEFGNDNSYDPTKRGWWRDAMAFYNGDHDKAKERVIITSAYQDFGTNRWMVTISKAFEWSAYESDIDGQTMPDGRGVSSADVTLEDLQNQILEVKFTGGFAALVHLNTGIVLALNQQTIDDPKCSKSDPDYCGDDDESSGGCKKKCTETKTIQEMEQWTQDGKGWDPEAQTWSCEGDDCIKGFPQEDLEKMKSGETGTTTYRRKGEGWKEGDEGDEWVIAFAPAFHNELGILLFAPKTEIDKTVDALGAKVGETTGVVIGVVIAVVLVTALITFVIVYFLIKSIARPLKNVEKVSNEIVKTSADANRNFRAHIKQIENVPMGDEIGELVHSFRAMVRGLYEADVKKRQAPKYPENTLYGQKGGPWEKGLNTQAL